MAIQFDYQNQKITVNGKEIINSNGVIASNVNISSHGTVTVTNLQDAIEQLADQFYYTETTPVGGYLREGALWYKASTLTLSIYREISPSVFGWTPLSTGTGDSETLDGGAYQENII